MKRYLVASLVAYAASMTLAFAWSAARGLVLEQLLMENLAGTPGARVDWPQALAYYGSPPFQTGPENLAAMLVAGVEPSTLAAATALILACCLAIAARRRRNPIRPDLEKD